MYCPIMSLEVKGDTSTPNRNSKDLFYGKLFLVVIYKKKKSISINFMTSMKLYVILFRFLTLKT